jgi:hypothetical protein
MLAVTAAVAAFMTPTAVASASVQTSHPTTVISSGPFASPMLNPGTSTFNVPATADECATYRAIAGAPAGTTCPDNVLTVTTAIHPATATELAASAAAGNVVPNSQCGSHTCTVYIETAGAYLCNGAIFGVGQCAIWKFSVNNAFYFDSVWVWANKWGYNQAWIDCPVNHAIGVGVDTRPPNGWCGWSFNPSTWGNTYTMNAGANAKVYGFFQGFPIQATHWLRLDEWPNGATSVRGG